MSQQTASVPLVNRQERAIPRQAHPRRFNPAALG